MYNLPRDETIEPIINYLKDLHRKSLERVDSMSRRHTHANVFGRMHSQINWWRVGL